MTASLPLLIISIYDLLGAYLIIGYACMYMCRLVDMSNIFQDHNTYDGTCDVAISSYRHARWGFAAVISRGLTWCYYMYRTISDRSVNVDISTYDQLTYDQPTLARRRVSRSSLYITRPWVFPNIRFCRFTSSCHVQRTTCPTWVSDG